MTALAKERLTESTRIDGRGTYPVAASTKIWKGSLVGLDSDGRAIPATALSTCKKVVGRACSTFDNSSGAAGAIDCEVDFGAFEWANSGSGDAIAADDVFKVCYAVDDQTVALTSNGGTRAVAGVIIEFKPTIYGGTSVPWVWTGPITGAISEMIAYADAAVAAALTS